jgi:hypothetical protein
MIKDLQSIITSCCRLSATGRPSALEVQRQLKSIHKRLIVKPGDNEYLRYESNRKRNISANNREIPDEYQCCRQGVRCSYYCYFGGCEKAMCSPEDGCSYVVQFTDERTAWFCRTCLSFITKDISTRITPVDGKPNHYKSDLSYKQAKLFSSSAKHPHST